VKTIGLIGGMSWQSSALYYRLINEETARRLGGHHNAPSVMVTVDFAGVEGLLRAGDWGSVGDVLADSARNLERAGADFMLLCTNTMHRVAGAITAAVKIPLLNIVDTTGKAIQLDGHQHVALLGTKFTMEDGFYRDRMNERFGIENLIPERGSREELHRIIFDELCRGEFREGSRQTVQRMIGDLRQSGATAVILGCTELELLISAADSILPVYASTAVHAKAAVDLALH
jgi:aspartate racemase